MKISVLMSAYNAEKYIKQAIQSVLNQTLADFEFIIINDASTDKTLEIIKSFHDPRIKLINNKKNLGLTKSLNIGLRQAQTKYIARLDADDIALPERLAQQYQFMIQHQEVALVGAGVELINKDGQKLTFKYPPTELSLIKFSLLFQNPFFHSTIFFRKAAVLDIGGYNEDFRYAQDYELYSRLIKKYQLANLKQPLVKFRIHPQSVTAGSESQLIMQRNALKIIYQNINNYLKLPLNEFYAIQKITFIKGAHSKISILNLIKSLLLLRRATNAFLRQEKLDKKEAKQILSYYKKYRITVWRRFLVSIKKLLFKFIK